MKRIAIVEDNPQDAAVLKNHIKRFAAETGEQCNVSVFENGLNFVDEYKSDFDVVFMDVEMPYINGLETAKKLREIDEYVSLIFITNMAQYAIGGYEVRALDFILKPVAYFSFSDKLKKVFANDRRGQEDEIFIKTADEQFIKIPISDIYYLEKNKNYIVYTTTSGVHRQRGTMKKMEDKLLSKGFAKNMTGCLVNLWHITKVTRDFVVIQNQELQISRQQRKKFMEDVLQYYGGG